MGANPTLPPEMVTAYFSWAAWEAFVRRAGITIDRPYGSRHPAFPEIVYPMNYGFVNDTTSSDTKEVDIFKGTADNGLVGLIMTHDRHRKDREMKLLFNCNPEEIYLALGFVNFDRRLMEGTLALRRPMRELWVDERSGKPHP